VQASRTPAQLTRLHLLDNVPHPTPEAGPALAARASLRFPNHSRCRCRRAATPSVDLHAPHQLSAIASRYSRLAMMMMLTPRGEATPFLRHAPLPRLRLCSLGSGALQRVAATGRVRTRLTRLRGLTALTYRAYMHPECAWAPRSAAGLLQLITCRHWRSLTVIAEGDGWTVRRTLKPQRVSIWQHRSGL
jgi:hypothetical protein